MLRRMSRLVEEVEEEAEVSKDGDKWNTLSRWRGWIVHMGFVR